MHNSVHGGTLHVSILLFPSYLLLIIQWDLICSRSFLPNLSQSVMFLGVLVGSWLFGIMSDMIGRKKAIFTAMIGACLSGLGYSLSSDFYVFAFFRMTVALCMAGLLNVYILCMELVGPAERSWASMITHGSFAVGIPVLAGMAYIIHEWRILCIAATLSGVTFVLLWRCACVCVYLCLCVCVLVLVCVCACACVCVYLCLCVCVLVLVCACACVCLCVCVCVCVCV